MSEKDRIVPCCHTIPQLDRIKLLKTERNLGTDLKCCMQAKDVRVTISMQKCQKTDPLIRLLFADLINLVKQLANPKLQLRKFIFGSNLLIVISLFTNLYA